MNIDINSDLGESFGDWTKGEDLALIQLVSSANIACGFHAGDARVMLKSVEACAKAGVAVGAHPGFPDREGFGRREMSLSPLEIRTDVMYQIGALQAMCKVVGVPLHHVKPHGAMQNMMAKDYEMSIALVTAIAATMEEPMVFAQPGSATEKAARDIGIRVARELFADRAYMSDGTLAPRKAEGAVLTDADEIGERTVRILRGEAIGTFDGGSITLEGDTLCVHGDSIDVVRITETLRKSLVSAGFVISPV